MHASMRCASQRSYRRGLVPTSPCTLNAALHRCPCRPPRHLANHVELFCVRAAVDNPPVLEMSASEAPTLYSIEKGCSACRSGLLSCLDHPHPRGRAPCATAAMHSNQHLAIFAGHGPMERWRCCFWCTVRTFGAAVRERGTANPFKHAVPCMVQNMAGRRRLLFLASCSDDSKTPTST